MLYTVASTVWKLQPTIIQEEPKTKDTDEPILTSTWGFFEASGIIVQPTSSVSNRTRIRNKPIDYKEINIGNKKKTGSEWLKTAFQWFQKEFMEDLTFCMHCLICIVL